MRGSNWLRDGMPFRHVVTIDRDENWPFIGPGSMSSAKPASIEKNPHEILAARIENFCALRQEVFDGLIHDAEFNVLIDVYLNALRGRKVSIGDACIAARVPQTTALRAIQTLVDAAMVIRAEDPRDSRRKLLSLTQQGCDRVSRFIDKFEAHGGFKAVSH